MSEGPDPDADWRQRRFVTYGLLGVAIIAAMAGQWFMAIFLLIGVVVMVLISFGSTRRPAPKPIALSDYKPNVWDAIATARIHEGESAGGGGDGGGGGGGGDG